MAIKTSDTTSGFEDVIANNIPSRAFRYTAENKNVLAEKGSIYVGTGNTRTTQMTTSDGVTSSYESATTTALNPPTANGTYVLKCIVTNGVPELTWVAEN